MNPDFENKRIEPPFTTPDGFEAELNRRLHGIPRRLSTIRIVKWSLSSAASLVLIATAVGFWQKPAEIKDFDTYIASMSDAELNEQLILAENDIFLEL